MYLAIVIVAVIIQAVIASIFTELAEEKGYGTKGIFAKVFFLGIAGMLYVVGLPDCRSEERLEERKARLLEEQKKNEEEKEKEENKESTENVENNQQ